MDEQNPSCHRPRADNKSQNGQPESSLRTTSPTRSYAPTHTRPRSDSTDSTVTILCIADRGVKWDLNEDKTVIWLQGNGLKPTTTTTTTAAAAAAAATTERDEQPNDTKSTQPHTNEAGNYTAPSLPSEQHQDKRLRVRLRSNGASACGENLERGDGGNEESSPFLKAKFRVRGAKEYAREYHCIADRKDPS